MKLLSDFPFLCIDSGYLRSARRSERQGAVGGAVAVVDRDARRRRGGGAAPGAGPGRRHRQGHRRARQGGQGLLAPARRHRR